MNKLQTIKKSISNYLGTTEHTAIRLIDAFLSNGNAYYAVGQDISLFFPRVRQLNGTQQPATFLFSGTATLSPELSNNPNIVSLPDLKLESFQRLHIYVQRGDMFNSSKTGLAKNQNQAALISWLEFVLPKVSQRHGKILVVTYKKYAKTLWHSLQAWHHMLTPYIGPDGQPQQLLPYFGGMNGSNLYLESTCVICLGLNRFEPRDYITRALALDFDGRCAADIDMALQTDAPFQLDRMPRVLDMQDITLARDIVQLVFRSALRKHGETQPIELWLLQPPNRTIVHLRSYFGDCHIEEITELPESCRIARATSKTYQGNRTHASRLLAFLQSWDGKCGTTPTEIREMTGLSQSQYKEAKKNPVVQEYFSTHIITKGSGKNTIYYKRQFN